MAVVLIVEGDTETRKALSDIVQDLGHRVMIAGGGTSALAVFGGGDRMVPDLLITDAIMPAMDGIDLARRARTMRPNLVVIYLAGRCDTIAKDDRELAGEMVMKPIAPGELRLKIKRALALSGVAPLLSNFRPSSPQRQARR